MSGKKNGRSIIVLISTLRGLSEHMRSVIWQPFALSLGASMSSLGGLESTYDLVKNLAQPFFGSGSDTLGRKRFLILREILFTASMLLFVFSRTPAFLFLGIGLLGLSYAVEPVWYTFIAEISDRANLASRYSLMYASYMGIGLIAPMMAGMLASSLGFSSVYTLSALFGLVSLLVVAKMIAETRSREASAKVALRKFMQSIRESIKPGRELRGFYLSMALDAISFGIGSRILYGMLTKSHGYNLYMISLLATSMTVSWAIVQMPLGKLIDRVGYKYSLIISQVLSSVYIGGLILTQSLWMVVILQALLGVAAALWVPAEQSWIASKVEPSKRGAYIGNYLAFKGLISFPAPFVGGLLFDGFGFSAPLYVNLAGAVIDVLLLYLLMRR